MNPDGLGVEWSPASFALPAHRDHHHDYAVAPVDSFATNYPAFSASDTRAVAIPATAMRDINPGQQFKRLALVEVVVPSPCDAALANVRKGLIRLRQGVGWR